MNTIPLFKPACTDEDVEAVTRVLRSGWWGMGPEVEAFEAEFAQYTGARYAVSVSSGTMALELAGRALDVTYGITIVPALTFVSSGLAMLHNDNQVIFADIEEESLCISWQDVHRILGELDHSRMDKAVVPVWYAGTVTEVPPVPEGVRVIEDCAHAAGSDTAGAWGDVACWSFHAVKNLAAGDGGMVTTDDENVAQEIKRLRWCGIDRSTWDRDKNSRVGYGWDYCVTPGTLILRSDLRHVPAREIKEGDRLVAFEEHPAPGKVYHKMQTAVVEGVVRTRKRSVVVRGEDGSATTCSEDHLWLVRNARQSGKGQRLEWVKAKNLTSDHFLLSLGTWEENRSRSAGYLAGLYDGEGSLETPGGGHKGTGLTFSQLPGPTLDAFFAAMNELALPVAFRAPHGTSPVSGGLTTSIKDIMRVLGTLQPERFKNRFEEVYEESHIAGPFAKAIRVSCVETAGVCELVSIRTTTRTLIANGFLSHNCIPGDGEKAHMNDISAALARSQLRNLDKNNAARRYVARAYNDEFRDVEWLQTPAVHERGSTHLYAVRVPAQDRDRFIRHCIEHGVSAGVHYKPLTAYKNLFGTSAVSRTPVTDRVWKTLVTLPLFPGITIGEVGKVMDTVKGFKPS